ncbi:MAG: hypothetical protein EOM59_11300 [Clostridia bacterium]|nr:hypothetical protein [Clostridia bacterium]
MCTSIISNRKKTIVGWNLDLLEMQYKVVAEDDKVYIAIKDSVEGWLPLFGANSRGDFVAMPTCWPFDERSNPPTMDCLNIIKLDIDMLYARMSFHEFKEIAQEQPIYSVPGVTFQAQISNRAGDVLQIVPGQGYKYFEKPRYSVLTNFSPFKQDREQHPWMGWDRYQKAIEMLEMAPEDFDVEDCFHVLRATSQTVIPTLVSMVYDVTAGVVYWCENRNWEKVDVKTLI